jgi:hypothetical protein
MAKVQERTDEEVAFRGKLFEIVHVTQPDGRVFEVARRAPGVRLIIDDPKAGKLLLTREFRRELDDWDYRLPGGKVFDTLEEYDKHLASGDDILPAALSKGKAEGREEAGIMIEELEHYKTSVLGATVQWDLFILQATKWHSAEDGQQLEEGEQIEAEGWYAYDEVKQMILDGKLQEERVALILLRWLRDNGKIYSR